MGPDGYLFHPDEAKQVLALFNFLHGDYIRHYGSLFYDGYPYGLNHLDEYLLRPLLFFFSPSVPEQHTLYIVARLLRVVYSLIIIFLVTHIVLRLTRDHISALLAFCLIGLSPLSITVCHFATGDIGVDLFCCLCILGILQYLRHGASWWLFITGLTVGMAFSVKYNGLLIMIIPAIVLALENIPERHYRRFFQQSSLLLAGSLIGILILTPALVLDFTASITNIVANFTFIKNYNVPPEILAKPWFEKAGLGLQANTLPIMGALGYTLCLGCCLLLPLTFQKNFKVDQGEKRKDILLLRSLSLFPVLSLGIALSGKYVVQPFHFSYLIPPLAICTGLLFSKLRASQWPIGRICALSLGLCAIIEVNQTCWRDNFFWRHEDTVYLEQNLPTSVYDREALYTQHSHPIRSLLLEPPNDAVFRNIKINAKGPDADLWNSIRIAPVPQVANPVGQDWIFLNGPSFPRNERMLPLKGKAFGATLKRYLVLSQGKPQPLFGLQSGSYPVDVTISFGGIKRRVSLEAHQQKIIDIKPRTWRSSRVGKDTLRIIPLRASVPQNDVWLTILLNQQEVEVFNLFGGAQEKKAVLPKTLPETLHEKYLDALSRQKYLEHRLSWRIMPGEKIPMWEVALAAGRYILFCDVEGLVDYGELGIALEDARGGNLLGQQTIPFRQGIQRLEYRFSKPFAPYQVRFVISSTQGSAQIVGFKLFPDYKTLAADFKNWQYRPPRWLSRFGAVSTD